MWELSPSMLRNVYSKTAFILPLTSKRLLLFGQSWRINRRIARCQPHTDLTFPSIAAVRTRSVTTMTGDAPIKTAEEGQRRNCRGQQLLTVHYIAEAVNGFAPHAVLIWHHGYGEHVGRYKWGAHMLGFLTISLLNIHSHFPHLPLSSCQFVLLVYAVFSQLAAAGIAVHSYDAHGHGQSEPSRLEDRAFVQNITDLVCLTSIPIFHTQEELNTSNPS